MTGKFGVIVRVVFLFLLLFQLGAASANSGKAKIDPAVKDIARLFAQPETEIDLAVARLTIEKLTDPSVDIAANLREIDRIASNIKKVPRYQENTIGKLNSIVQYLYHAGKWNDNKPYHYDFNDPLGTAHPENSRLSHYLKTRTGNCVSMPLLVLLIGERLGLDVHLAVAPLHLFVKVKVDGQNLNFEATSGGLKSNESYMKEFLITPDAIKNGIYLRNLSKKQTIAVMITELAQIYSRKSQKSSDFDKSFEFTQLMLKYDPNNVSAMLIRGNTWRNILNRDLNDFKSRKIPLTIEIKRHFDALLSRNLQWYSKAESLGWREPPRDYDERYLKMVNEVRKVYE